jgi:hypothetical protein
MKRESYCRISEFGLIRQGEIDVVVLYYYFVIEAIAKEPARVEQRRALFSWSSSVLSTFKTCTFGYQEFSNHTSCCFGIWLAMVFLACALKT